MVSPILLTRTHLERALTPEQARTTAIIRVALLLGVLFFFLVLIFLFGSSTPDDGSMPDTSLMDLLSVIHLVFTISAATLAFVLAHMQLKKQRLFGNTNVTTPEQAADLAITLFRTSTLLLMAPLEAAAFFGGAICMIGIQNGTMDLYPMYWLNAGSACLMVLVGLITFPTRERTLSTLESAFIES